MQAPTRFALLLLAIALSTVLSTGCGGSAGAVKTYGDGAPSVRLAVVVDDLKTRATDQAPAKVFEGVANALATRKLIGAPYSDGRMLVHFRSVHDTDGRLEYLQGTNPDGVVALVELQAEFYSALSGQNRWTLHVSVAVAEAGRQPLRTRFAMPVVLYPYQREPAVYAQAAEVVGRRLGRMIDDYLAGRSVDHSADVDAGSAKAVVEGSIYFVLVDRFFNGEPSNDHAVNSADPVAWHGGDLQGVIQKLDHLKALGVQTIWLSPIFEAREAPWMGHAAFHGYWVYDLGRMNPRLGAADDLARLRREAHDRGMRIMLDMVVNHVGYGAPILAQRPTLFHPQRTIEDWNDPQQLVERQVHGLPDLAQERPEVAAMLTKAGLMWAERADAFRLDAVKHVPLSFWAQFNGRLAEAHPKMMRLGELFDGDPAKVDRVRREGGFTHMFDFPLSFALRDVFCKGAPVGRLAAVLAADRLYEQPAHSLVSFIDNHDLPRVRSVCGGAVDKVKHALTAQYALRGMVALNYGTEAGLEGQEEPANRGDMVFSGSVFDTLSSHIGALHRLRQAFPVFALGSTAVVQLDEQLLVLERRLGPQIARVVINTGPPQVFAIPPGWRRVGPTESATLDTGGVGLLLATELQPVRDAAPVAIEVKAEATLKPGESLRLVGNLPEIGAWNPAHALRLDPHAGAHVARFTAPPDLGLAYKLVVVAEDGTARWDPRPNRYARTASGLVLTPKFDTRTL